VKKKASNIARKSCMRNADDSHGISVRCSFALMIRNTCNAHVRKCSFLKLTLDLQPHLKTQKSRSTLSPVKYKKSHSPELRTWIVLNIAAQRTMRKSKCTQILESDGIATSTKVN
jgi:hypothetical protein